MKILGEEEGKRRVKRSDEEEGEGRRRVRRGRRK